MTKKKYFYILKPTILGVYVLLSTPSTKPTMNAAFTAARVLLPVVMIGGLAQQELWLIQSKARKKLRCARCSLLCQPLPHTTGKDRRPMSCYTRLHT